MIIWGGHKHIRWYASWMFLYRTLFRTLPNNFPIKSVFRKLIKVLCWLWIFTYATIFILSYGNVLFCFTNITVATITFSLMHYRWGVPCLILQIKKFSYVFCFPNYNKVVFLFYKNISMHIVHLINRKVFQLKLIFPWFSSSRQFGIKDSHFCWWE